jgi:threonine/homoserine/homoserine lactone efflux protein
VLLACATFALAAALIVLLPGPDTLVVVRNILRGGRAKGIATAAGNLVGLCLWVAAAALGLSALLRASTVGYDVLRFAGAAYLLWLGVQTLRARSIPEELAAPTDLTAAGQPPGPSALVGSGFGAGLVTNLLNPKVGVFFITFLPGFVPHGHSVGLTSLLFGVLFVLETAAYWALLLSVAARVTRWMNQPRIRRRMNAATGAVLVAFGLRLAVES